MKKTKQAIQEKGSITKGMYIKESKGLPVIYTPFQDIDAFCSVYCRGKDGIPLILNSMMHKIEDEILREKTNGWEKELSKREYLDVQIQAWRQAQKIWNFFWTTAMEISEDWKFPFTIRMRRWKANSR